MGANAENVNAVKPLNSDRAALSQTRAAWGDLSIAVCEGDQVKVADLLNDIEEDMKLADVMAACNPKGGA